MAENQQERISRERRKLLLSRLKSEVDPYKRDLYIAAVLSWIRHIQQQGLLGFVPLQDEDVQSSF